jgi:hypothetical protein
MASDESKPPAASPSSLSAAKESARWSKYDSRRKRRITWIQPGHGPRVVDGVLGIPNQQPKLEWRCGKTPPELVKSWMAISEGLMFGRVEPFRRLFFLFLLYVRKFGRLGSSLTSSNDAAEDKIIRRSSISQSATVPDEVILGVKAIV